MTPQLQECDCGQLLRITHADTGTEQVTKHPVTMPIPDQPESIRITVEHTKPDSLVGHVVHTP